MHDILPFRSDTEIASIGRALIDRSLPKPQWTHAAHFAAALWFLATRPNLDVLRELPLAIKAYNLATGVANSQDSGYHETITLASIRAARFDLRRQPDRPIFEITNLLMASELGDPDWLLTYWSRGLLFSAHARLNWCEPDLESLPF